MKGHSGDHRPGKFCRFNDGHRSEKPISGYSPFEMIDLRNLRISRELKRFFILWMVTCFTQFIMKFNIFKNKNQTINKIISAGHELFRLMDSFFHVIKLFMNDIFGNFKSKILKLIQFLMLFLKSFFRKKVEGLKAQVLRKIVILFSS